MEIIKTKLIGLEEEEIVEVLELESYYKTYIDYCKNNRNLKKNKLPDKIYIIYNTLRDRFNKLVDIDETISGDRGLLIEHIKLEVDLLTLKVPDKVLYKHRKQKHIVQDLSIENMPFRDIVDLWLRYLVEN